MNADSLLKLLVAAIEAVLAAFKNSDYDTLEQIAKQIKPEAGKPSTLDKVKKLLGRL